MPGHESSHCRSDWIATARRSQQQAAGRIKHGWPECIIRLPCRVGEDKGPPSSMVVTAAESL